MATYIRGKMATSEFRVVQDVQRVVITEELLEPEEEELEELVEPEPEELVEVEQMDSEMDEMPDALPSADDMLGLDADGVAGGDAFGLAARRGGRDLLKTGNGIGCEWYATVLNAELNQLLLPIMRGYEQLLGDSWSVLVQMWLLPDGGVARYKVSSTGDPSLDRDIRAALDRFDRVQTPPPPDMPQPVRLRLRCHV